MDPDKQQNKGQSHDSDAAAVELIRNKLNNLYAKEPGAEEELAEVKAIAPEEKLSTHQAYMKNLSSSGKSLAEIQTAWHEYYTQLDNQGKHEVWQEFYAQHNKAKPETGESPKPIPDKTPVKEPEPSVSHNTAQLSKRGRPTSPKNTQAAANIRDHLLSKVESRAKSTKNPHVKALAFGLSMGFVTIFIMLFGFFNERFITPFIRPNTNVSATPIIIDPEASGPVGPESKIIIPKINVEAPVVYDVPTIEEDDVQKGLENGVVHYPTTPNPGEMGNAVIFGHSSSNILNKGKYKFAFLLLKSLEKDDTFIVQKDGKRYVYKIYNKFVVPPTDMSVLGAPPADKPAVMTLITCDPPGTSTNRLIIQAEQIFPDPKVNAPSSVPQTQSINQAPEQLPSNSVSLWQRIKNWF